MTREAAQFAPNELPVHLLNALGFAHFHLSEVVKVGGDGGDGDAYLLVIEHSHGESPYTWWFLAGKIIYFYEPFSMAMLDNQRVNKRHMKMGCE